MTVGTFFWIVGAIMFVIAGILVIAKSTFNPLAFVLFGVASGFLALAFDKTALPARRV